MVLHERALAGMIRLAAYLRHDVLTAASYRMRYALSIAGLAAGAVPLYFVAEALQPVMAAKIAGQGSQYFSFILLGLAAQQFVMATADALPRAIHEGIRTGTLEALFATPTPVPLLMAGMMSFRFLWALLQASVLVVAGLLLGASFSAAGVFPAVVLVFLIALSYLPFGLLAGALHLRFRTAGPLPLLVGTGSVLLGGVYYPTDVIPSWIAQVSAFIPLTYGVRALRKVLLEGSGAETILTEVAMLLALLTGLLAVSAVVFQRAIAYARRTGTLGQY